MTAYQFWNTKENDYTTMAICAEHYGMSGKAKRLIETAKACRLVQEKLSLEEAEKEVDENGN